jgi:hypothetical protein
MNVLPGPVGVPAEHSNPTHSPVVLKGTNGRDLDRIQRAESGLQIDGCDGEIRPLRRR